MSSSVLIPSIRFKGFTDPWEQRKFSDCATLARGLTYSPSDIRDDGIRVLRSSNIDEDQYVERFDDVFVREGAVKMPLAASGDILITAANGSPRLVGKRAIISLKPNEKVIAGGFMLTAKCADPEFLYASMGSAWYRTFLNIYVAGGNGAIGNLNKNELDLFTMPWAEVQERKKIGSLFSSMNSLITLHQRKLEKIKCLKKALLEKMFPESGESKPRIRFKGFVDPWEQRKLLDYLLVCEEKNNELHYGKEDVLSVSQDFGVVNQIEFQGRSFAGSSVANYGILPTFYVVYTKSPLSASPYGIIRTNKGKTGIVSTLYAVYQPIFEQTDPCFLQTYFENNYRQNKYLRPLVNKGAKNDMKVSAANALKGPVVFPHKDEQTRIYALFSQIDSLITLHQRKLEKLKNIKKSLLEKMFVA